jgi:hypothetical protein
MPVCVDDLDEEELTQTERIAVKKIIYGDTKECGLFSKLGWIDEAQSWIRENVADHNVDFNEDVRQLSASGAFALVRFGTVQGPAYWLKATAAPNAHEFTVTQTIARCCSRFAPPLIATRQDWNAWVSEDAGEPLYAALNLPSFEQAIHCLAQMQLMSAAHVGELQAGGFFDLRLPTCEVAVIDDCAINRQSNNVANGCRALLRLFACRCIMRTRHVNGPRCAIARA